MSGYSPGAGTLEAPVRDPWQDFGNAINPMNIIPNILNMLQLTPQLDASKFDIPPIGEEEARSMIGQINSLGLFGEGPGQFSQAELDKAFRQNSAGDGSAIRAIIDRVSKQATYLQSYAPLEQSAWGLVNTLQGDINTPIYSDADIQNIVGQNRADTVRNRDANIAAARENLAGRGILESGMTADLVTQARQVADEAISRGNVNIPTQLRKENKSARDTSEQLMMGAQGMVKGLSDVRAGMTPDFSPNDVNTAIQNAVQNREAIRYTNATGTKQSLQETKDDTQQQFENIMSMIGMFKNSKPSGGGGGSGSISGSVGFPGVFSLGSGTKV